MKKRQIVNIVNFIRAVEPRTPTDMLLPVREQIRLMKKHRLRGTFLLQYDALILPEFTALLKELDPAQFEFGVWFETVRPLVERAGLEWRGRFSWDWHAHCGFSVGYTKENREKLADIFYEEFKRVFGAYPRVFGSWFFDSHTVRYISDKYGIDALCNCKEQFGTDGYTLWGGYYGQGYYPSRTNVFMPAQNREHQLPAPLFRMLGSDPVYQYDAGLDMNAGAEESQRVITLEPVYSSAGGGNKKWVDWYMSENFNGDCLSFGYAQAGQENSFGWPGMREGLTYQFALFEKLQNEGKITVEPLGDTGRWFKRQYSETPASAITAHSAWNDSEKKSVWFSNKNYRANLFLDHGILRFRDVHLFRESFPDPFENTVCQSNSAVYETLPLVDGNLHSGNGVLSGLYFTKTDGSPLLPEGEMNFTENADGSASVDFGTAAVTFRESSVRIESSSDFILAHRLGRTDRHMPSVLGVAKDCLRLFYKGENYSARLSQGVFADEKTLLSVNGAVEASFD